MLFWGLKILRGGFDFEYESTGDPIVVVLIGEQRCLFDDLPSQSLT